MPILFYNIQGNVTVSVTYNPTLARWPGSRRTGPGEGSYVTLIIKHIVTYACTQFEISLTHQINLIAQLCFITY